MNDDFNRVLCKNMTLEEHGLDLATSGNWGALKYMINSIEGDIQVDDNLIRIVEEAVFAPEWPFIILCFEKGMPIETKFKGEYPFAKLIQSTDQTALKYPREGDRWNRSSRKPIRQRKYDDDLFIKSVAYSAAIYLKNCAYFYGLEDKVFQVPAFLSLSKDETKMFFDMVQKEYFRRLEYKNDNAQTKITTLLLTRNQ